MATVVNKAQAQAWNGYEGQHWADHFDRYDAVNSGFNEQLLTAARIGDGDRVLDIGCGNGQLTRLAAKRTCGGFATGIDLSEPMLAGARARAIAEQIANIRFERGDAQVHPFADHTFDAAVSRFGIMFFADPVAAFTNIGRSLAVGGQLAFVAMTSMAGTELGEVFGSLREQLPELMPHDGSGPTNFANPDSARDILSAAGFTRVNHARAEAEAIWGRDAADAARFLTDWGPIRHHLPLVAAGAPDRVDRVRATLTEAFMPFEIAGAVRLRATAWLFTASI